jgi:hypothetical protein
MLEDIGKGKWVMKDNLAPTDNQSVKNAIESMRTTPGTPLPDFDLTIGYSVPEKSSDSASKDLVTIRYRQSAGDAEDALNPQPDEPAPIGMLECDFTRRSLKDLHRLAWTHHRKGSERYSNAAQRNERLRQLEKDYVQAFPDSEDDSDGLLY